MRRKRYLDVSLPTIFSFALLIAVLSLWSDVWEFYWLIVAVLFLLNAWYFREVIKRGNTYSKSND
jgi:phosphoglycerol transferase MdoB-like AlkP superfamily enzyme